MSEEDEPEWQAYSRACSIIGDIVQCKYCNKNMIAEESAAHLIENHNKEAKEVKELCRKRLNWERQARWMTDEMVESMQ